MQLLTVQISSTQVFDSRTNPALHLFHVLLSALQSLQLLTTQSSPHDPDDNSFPTQEVHSVSVHVEQLG